MKTLLIVMIRVYQKTLSPDHGLFRARHPYGYCRFYPTCSEYSVESIKEFGVIKGLFLTIKRLLKCNPFSSPGIDKINKL